MIRLRALVIGLAALCLAGCGGGAVGSTLSACTSVSPPTLVYPAQNATGVPDGNFQLIVSYGSNPGSAFNVPSLNVSGAGSVNGGAWTAGSSGQWTSAIPALSAATTYKVTVTNSACAQTYTLGTFTTQ
jgi:hypothetical protein